MMNVSDYQELIDGSRTANDVGVRSGTPSESSAISAIIPSVRFSLAVGTRIDTSPENQGKLFVNVLETQTHSPMLTARYGGISSSASESIT